MKVAVVRERRANEPRVAASPETVGKMTGMGLEVMIEAGAGAGASFLDEDFERAGASIAKDAKSVYADADIVLKVMRPTIRGEGADEVAMMKKGAVLISMLQPHDAPNHFQAYEKAEITAFSMELLPRITRAQSMDVLSSQSNLAGYRAVIDAAAVFTRGIPMMMTAAGTVAPAKVCVLGAGVAGLQAIATARRLGGVVSAFDVRPAVKEQVESLGATFVDVDPEAAKDAETAGGYAREMSEDYKKKQAEVLRNHLKKQDMVIATALIPGRPAPVLITEEMVRDMKTGSVIVDLAVERGGNCELAEAGEVVEAHGVKIVGHLNVPGSVAVDASLLYAKNLLNFLTPLIDPEAGELRIDWEDEIIAGACLTRDGKTVHPSFTNAE